MQPVINETYRVVIPHWKKDAINEWTDGQEFTCTVNGIDPFSGMAIGRVNGQVCFMDPDWLTPLPKFTEPDTLRPPPTLDDWRAWAEDKPGYCPCGISKKDCDYHK